MGGTGAPWDLSYPDGTDRPSQAFEALFNLADDMDYHLSNWQKQWDRLRRRPAAKLTYDSTVRYAINKTALSTVQYNNVQLDTANMTDLQRRADRLYLPHEPRPSLYMIGGTVVGWPTTVPSVPDIRLATNAQWSIDTTPNPDVPYAFDTRDLNQARTDQSRGETFQVSSLILNYVNTAGYFASSGAGSLADIWVQIEINSGVEFTVYYADLYAFWVTDIANIPFV